MAECAGDTFVCYNTAMCQLHYSAIAGDVYCNPGNDRCMMKIGPGCAADF